ncbi:DUF692 domain-containing protein [Sulfuriflexus mobilis]|uniref:MNIO family bufferin maturase n=1 Tax=Sulfuriflexus mobilis TaxID=1811807 RepID=UPI000F819B10|nr:DUF692 domain-containing protein [Sulfuriflexus mobilis]
MNVEQPNIPEHPTSRPYLGYGLGLRTEYYDTILEQQPNVDWLEIISENYMVDGGKALHYLDRFRERYPIVMHGVSLSIGSTDPLDQDYLRRLKGLVERINPVWLSDHLCWTGQGGHNVHDLLPLPYNTPAVSHLVDRIKQVQDFLGRQILMENVSSYVTYTHSQMSEWEFYSTIVEQADCLMLLDINNIYVSAVNHGFAPLDYLNGVPRERVQQIHLAGHTDYGDFIVDTHDHPVVDPVWDLYARAVERFGAISTMIERDDNFPPFDELMAELDQARAIGDHVLGKQQCTA